MKRNPSSQTLIAQCRCGNCELVLAGPPIVTTECYCNSCQTAGRKFAALAATEPTLQPNGGTAYVLHRKDRVSCRRGAERLREFRLKPEAPTRRVVATCCNSPMFLEFSGGHWLSVFRDRIDASKRPATEMRTMTKDRPAGVEFEDALPSYAKHSGRFMWRLLAAWAAMGFRAPKIHYVKGNLDG